VGEAPARVSRLAGLRVPAPGERQALARLTALIQALNPSDRQVMLLYLEDLDGAEISQITGLSVGAVAVKVHRLKSALVRRIQGGAA